MKIRLALLLASSLLLTLGCPATPEPGTDTLSINDTQATDTQSPGDIKQDIDPGDAIGDAGPDSGESDVAVDTGEPKGVWEIRSLGDEGVVADMFAVTDGPTYAVGGTRVIAHMGGFWAAYGDPVDQPLHGVWADENVVVVVGEGARLRVVWPVPWTGSSMNHPRRKTFAPFTDGVLTIFGPLGIKQRSFISMARPGHRFIRALPQRYMPFGLPRAVPKMMGCMRLDPVDVCSATRVMRGYLSKWLRAA